MWIRHGLFVQVCPVVDIIWLQRELTCFIILTILSDFLPGFDERIYKPPRPPDTQSATVVILSHDG